MELHALPMVDFVLLAEFDIDQGSILSVQHPRQLPLPEGQSDREAFHDSLSNLMLPDGCQNLEWDYSHFILYRRFPEQDANQVSPALYGLNLVHRKLDSTVRRGAIVKALAVLSPVPELCFADGWATGLFPLLRRALLEYFTVNAASPQPPDSSPLRDLFQSLNEAANRGSVRRIRSDSPFLAYSVRSVYQRTHATYRGDSFRVQFPISCHASAFAVGSISNLIRLLGLKAVLELHRAIVIEKNVLFLAHNISSSELCTQVLAATLLVSPTLQGLLEQRVFPYVSFNDLDFQNVQGFIAGTTNPFFKESCPYDLLVDLNEGVLHPKAAPGTPKKKALRLKRNNKSEIDSDFVKFLETGIHTLSLGETWIKRQFQNYTIRIADVSARHSETPAQYYENMAHFVSHVPACRWFREQQSNTRSEALPSCIRQLCYAMNGLYKDMCHGTILSCLTTLCEQPDTPETKEQVIALLMKYFGTVDLTDAINRVTGSNDHELVQKFQCLNASLMATFSDLYFADLRLLQF